LRNLAEPRVHGDSLAQCRILQAGAASMTRPMHASRVYC
jgi:hypothetical protein